MKALKTIFIVAAAAAALTACSDSKERYVDLSTGQPVELVKDEQTGFMVDATTKKPVRIYVDTRTHDTIWGSTGKVINGSIRLRDNGTYMYVNADGDDMEVKSKTDEDGSSKVKVGDDYKKKVDEDGDVKIKDGDTKIKIDGKTGKRKVKKD